MNYLEAREYIREKERLGSVMGLDTIRELLRRLGNPETCAPVIHIAGTNGKGSIMAYIEETFVKTGMTVGRYISPAIYDYRERWKRNKQWASEEDVARAVTAVSKRVDMMIRDGWDSPTAFEIETAVAYWLFNDWKCDIMLIETGMGGALDATNVHEKDVLSVLSSISMDHMDVLGDSLEEITRQKLGIVRDNTVLVTYPQTDEVMTVIMDYTVQHNVKLIVADREELIINEETFHSASFTYKGEDYDISVGGEYQILNAITAIEVLKYFQDVCGDMIYMGLLTTLWSGRFTVAHRNPMVIIDGAHNEDAWIRLRESLDKYFTNKKYIYIMGIFSDKEYDRMIAIMSPTMKRCYTVESENARSMASEELAERLRAAGVAAESVGAVEDAIGVAMDEADETDVIVICGTLSITGRALEYFNVEE